jgi:hypothetical protein
LRTGAADVWRFWRSTDDRGTVVNFVRGATATMAFIAAVAAVGWAVETLWHQGWIHSAVQVLFGIAGLFESAVDWVTARVSAIPTWVWALIALLSLENTIRGLGREVRDVNLAVQQLRESVDRLAGDVSDIAVDRRR